jgi:hypothetical protein
VLETILAMWEEYPEERYRPAPALVGAARAERGERAERALHSCT